MPYMIFFLPNAKYLGYTNGHFQGGYAHISNDLLSWANLPLPFTPQVGNYVAYKITEPDKIIFVEHGWNNGMKRSALYSLTQNAVVSTADIQDTGRINLSYPYTTEKFQNNLIAVSAHIYGENTGQKLFKTQDGINFSEILDLPDQNNITAIVANEQRNRIGLFSKEGIYLTDFAGSFCNLIGNDFDWDGYGNVVSTDDVFMYTTNEYIVKRIVL
jgi:hypothetical protein